jgi:hypothetical protein
MSAPYPSNPSNLRKTKQDFHMRQQSREVAQEKSFENTCAWMALGPKYLSSFTYKLKQNSVKIGVIYLE